MQGKCSLLERIGGDPAVARICDSLYARVLIDDSVADFFSGMDMNELVERQRRFLRCLLNDHELVQTASLRRIHQHLVERRGLNDSHFDAMKALLDESMVDAGIDAILRNHVLNRMETTRRYVLNKQTSKETTMTGKILSALYGVTAYTAGMASLVYIGLWLINLFVGNGVDAPAQGPLLTAIAVDLGLIAAFALQHSGMARPAFKRWWTRFIPAHLERSTYVLVSGITTAAVCWFWQPLGGVVWEVQSEAGLVIVYTLYALGWALLVMSTFWINHFDLFGLRQLWFYLADKPYTHVPFQTPGMYRYVRHPLYLGWFTVFWAAPVMTVSHLAFALLATIYTFIAIQFEERDLEEQLPEYRRYKRTTPMLIPGTGGTPPRPGRRGPVVGNPAHD